LKRAAGRVLRQHRADDDLAVGDHELPVVAGEVAERLFVSLALSDLLVVVGAAVAVRWRIWVTAAMWIAWFRRRLPRRDSR
jgi:hypothetical protein